MSSGNMLGIRTPQVNCCISLAFSPVQEAMPGTGLLTLVREDIPHYKLPLVSEFQAKAIRVKL